MAGCDDPLRQATDLKLHTTKSSRIRRGSALRLAGLAVALLGLAGLAPGLAAQTTLTVGSASDLVSALTTIDNNTSTSYVVNFTSDVTLTTSTTLPVLNTAASVVINGNGYTLDGGGVQRGFLVYGGTVSIIDLTISDTQALGGSGGPGGGGGAGFGGALFVANGANVTVSNVTLTDNSAVGGTGGPPSGGSPGGGGGGMGGNGGSPSSTFAAGTGGGGLGLGADGGTGAGSGSTTNGSSGIAIGLASAGSGGDGGGTGGTNGGGGGGGHSGGGGQGGGGGGIGGATAAGFEGSPGGAGGFGGGGGGAEGNGGAGGFGGGGGSAASGDNGAGGGFGGGGGSSNSGSVGTGGFGGGKAHGTDGGGGAGMGGAIFVQQGGSLTLAGTLTVNGNTVTAGAGAGSAASGSALGADLFLQGNGAITFAPGSGQTQTVSDVIADQTGSGGSGDNAGSWGLTLPIFSGGTLVLSADETYTGPTMVEAGTLDVDGSLAADSTVSVFPGATLCGTGTIEGDVLLWPGATVCSTLTVAGTITDVPSYTVTSTADSGAGSLRQAITDANASPDGGYISFSLSTLPAAITLASTLPSITGTVIIAGPGASNLAISGNNQVQVFSVSSGATAIISGVTVENGLSTSGTSGGGGIYNDGTLTLSSCVVTENQQTNSGTGAGIYNDSSGNLTIQQCTVSNNTANTPSGVAGEGAGLNNAGTVTITDSTFSGNTAAGGGDLGGRGGAIFNGGTVMMVNSTLTGNSVTDSYNQGGGGGGAIFNTNTNSRLIITDSTIAGNSETGTGPGDQTGGIYLGSGTVTLTNTVLAGNTDTFGDPDGFGTFTDGGYNLIGNGSGISGISNGVNGDQVGVATSAVNLAPLASYGGTTQTMLPLPESAAICAGSASAAASAGITADQRGVAMSLTTTNAGTYTGAGGYCTAGSIDTGAVQTDYAMTFTGNEPGGAQISGVAFTAGVTLTENGLAVSGVSIPVTASAGTLTGSPVSATTNTSGVAGYSLTLTSGTALSDVTLTATLPAPPTLTATSLGFSLTPPAPTITGISPAEGVNTGGTQVTITGTNFTGATAVEFGSAPAASFTVNSATQITAVSPAGTGTVDVTVTTAGGTSATSAADEFTDYTALTAAQVIPSETLTAGTAVNFTPVTGAGGYGALSYAITSGTLPTGLSISSATGAISGTPTALVTNAGYTATVTDQAGNAASAGFTLTVTTPNYVVNTNQDLSYGTGSGYGSCTALTSTTSNTTDESGGVGICSLRAALTEAGTAGAANIYFDTTVFTAGNLTETPNPNIITLGSAGTLNIPSQTAIYGATSGSGASLTNLVTVSGAGGSNGDFSIFMVDLGVTDAAIANLTITDGHHSGGGIYNDGTLTVTGSTFSGNTAGSEGGGIYNLGTLTVSNSTFFGNTAPDGGGGIFNVSTLTVTSSTFSGNTTDTAGGGINNFGTLTVTGSTFSGNTAGIGGGIYNFNGGVWVLANSIVAGNTATSEYGDIEGSYTDDGGNLAGTSSSGTSQIAAVLGTLANYGGPTQTMLPLPGSAAICAASASAAASAGLASDQRGVVLNLTPSNASSYTGAGGYCPAGSLDAGAVQSDYALSFSTQPQPISPATAILAGASFQAAITLDENNAPFTAASETIPLTLASTPSGATLTGGSAATSSGVASYSALQASAVGTDTLTATLALNASPAVSISAASTTFSVGQATPTLTFAPSPASQTYGTAIAAASLNATASYNGSTVNGTFVYTTTVNGNPETLTAGNTVLPAGSYTIAAAFTPSDTSAYVSTSMTGSYTVAPAPLTITASGGTMTYGGTAPTITPSYSGFVNADTAASLTTAPACSTTATSTSAVGSYPSSCTGAADANYTITYAAGSVTVTQAPVTLGVTATPSAPAYGTLVTLTGTVSPAITAATASSFSFQIDGGTANSAVVPAAAYSGGTVSAAYGQLKAGAHTVALAFSGTTNYTASSSTAAPIQVSAAAPSIAWTPAASLVYGTSLAALLNAASSYSGSAVPGSFAYTAQASGSAAAPVTAATVLSAGSYTLTATFTPMDTTDYKTATASSPLTVSPAALAIAANNAARVYGAANPAFTGTVAGAVNGDTFTESFATAATPSSNAGTYAIVPSVAGANLSDYAVTPTNGTLTITQATSATTLEASSASITPGESVTLTATVADTSSGSTGTPTGTVSFYDGTTLLDTATLSGGTASYSTTSLAASSSNSLTAVYSGDENFVASSAGSAVSVTVASLNFTMTLTGPASATVEPGGTITYAATVTPEYGSYAGPVSFAISGLPAGATATFSPSSIPANGGTQTVTVTITFPQTSAANHPPSAGQRLAPVSLALLLLPFAGALRKRGRALSRLTCLLLLALAGMAATAGLSGCASSGGYFAQKQQSYQVTITATAGPVVQTAVVTISVE